MVRQACPERVEGLTMSGEFGINSGVMSTILEAFQNNVLLLGDKTCLKYKTNGKWQSLSWRGTAARIDSYAAGLEKLGVRQADKVGILSSTRVEWTLLDMAILKMGAVCVPVYPSLAPVQTAYILKDAGVSALFVENAGLLEKFGPELKQLPELKHIILFEGAGDGCTTLDKLEGDPMNTWDTCGYGDDMVASIIYTSGTTGEPKGVIITHGNITAEVAGLRRIFSFGHDEVVLMFLPLAHVVARAQQFYQLAEGCQAAYAESLEKLAQNFLEVRPHFTVVVPRVLEKIYNQIMTTIHAASGPKRKLFNWAIDIGQSANDAERKGRAPSLFGRIKCFLAKALVFSKLHKKLGGRLRMVISGGAPLSEQLAKFFRVTGLLALDGYGLTETMAAICINRPDDFHFGTAGKPLDGASLKIADDGEILVKGGMVFKEYYHKKQETREAFTEGGWFKTGDIGAFSKDGFLRITDRKKNLIVTSGGKNVAPQAIEALIMQSPYISNVFIYGDKRNYITALITLNMEMIKGYAAEHGILCANISELVLHEEIKGLISSIIEEKNKGLAHFETIKKFAILDCDFTVESGDLTPTMKIRRKFVESKYKDLLDNLYGSSV